MTDELNKQYFESRKKYSQNVSPKAFLYVIPIIIFFLIVGTYIVDVLPKKNSSNPTNFSQNALMSIDSLTATEISKKVDRDLEANSVIRYRQLKENKIMYHSIDSIVPGIRIDSIQEAIAREVFTEYYSKVRSKGNYIYLTNLDFDKDFNSYYDIIISPISDQFKLIEQVGTWAPNYDLENEDIVDWFKKRYKEFEFNVVVVDLDRIEANLISKPKSVKKLANEIYKFCPDVIEQGHDNIEELIELIDKQEYMWFWWD